MPNKIIALAGLSGSGKTTLAERLQSNEYAPVFVGRIMKDFARREGFDTLTGYVNHYGIREGFEKVRELLLSKIIESHSHANAVVDGVYDDLLLDSVRDRLGKANVLVVLLEPGFKERWRRYSLGKPVERSLQNLLRRDAIKLYVGAGRVMANATIVINCKSQEEVLKELQERIAVALGM